jgi:hypothetical protein
MKKGTFKHLMLAALVEKYLNPADKQKMAQHAVGSGAIAAGDKLITDLKAWPLGSTYLDKVARVKYTRIAETAPAGAIGDWAKAVALTVHS